MNDIIADIAGLIVGVIIFALGWFLITYFPAKREAGIFERDRIKYRVLFESFKKALLFGVFFILINFLIDLIKDLL